MKRALLAAWIVYVLILLGAAAITSYAFAHDHGRPDLNKWFQDLRSRAKAPCCDGSDAVRLDDPDWESRDGHYRVRIEGEWVDVPDSALIDGPNLDGKTMVWPYHENGHPRVRCFMPGAMI